MDERASAANDAGSGLPRIGITLSIETGGARMALEVLKDYVDAIMRAGGVPMAMAPTARADVQQAYLDGIDAYLIPGGPDIDPQRYGQDPAGETKIMAPERENFDFAMLARAEALRMPVLGICLGCQVMNVHRHGNLRQHVPEHRKSELEGNAHAVTIAPGTLLRGILGQTKISVNSRHHQTIDRLAEGLTKSAGDPSDGVIEAIEDPALPFWLGVQWHPENLGGSEHDTIFTALIRAAAAYRNAAAPIRAAIIPEPKETSLEEAAHGF